MRLNARWTLLPMLGLMISLSACETVKGLGSPTAASVVALPSLPSYGPAFQARLADELAAMPGPCDPLEPSPDCSAAKRVIRDADRVFRAIRSVN